MRNRSESCELSGDGGVAYENGDGTIGNWEGDSMSYYVESSYTDPEGWCKSWEGWT